MPLGESVAGLLADVEHSGAGTRFTLLSSGSEEVADPGLHDTACRMALADAGTIGAVPKNPRAVTVDEFYGWSFDWRNHRLALPSRRHGFRGPEQPELSFSPGVGPFEWWTTAGGSRPFYVRRAPRPGFGFAWKFVESIRRLGREETLRLFLRVVGELLGSPDQNSEILRWELHGDRPRGVRQAYTLSLTGEGVMAVVPAAGPDHVTAGRDR
ncbi:MAG: hypothetical protein JJLCMIEE_03109 [Acidimicrobiales bacterium]|nr:MAG: hypothetical protein EDR02_15250 [Actinomycetota bacterium]MBV6509990.1 hypothetical protein [Acidimicrobiales bacterium]RIK04318.1 MAG: hypothetical protein DCC48_13840 [Acidobacteriota bacterium]